MMFRTALTSALPAALALFVLWGCEKSSDDGAGGYPSSTATTGGGAGKGVGGGQGGGGGKGGGGGGGSGGGTGGGSGGADHGVNTGIPCRQILDCRALCDKGDNACSTGCYEAAYPHGQELEAALEKCYVDNGCQDWSCAEVNCDREVKECDADVPPGGYVCFAEGIYQVCDHYGLCTQYPGYGGGWGATEQYAAFWGVYDCNDFMTSMVIINSTTGFASVVSDCSITKCSPN